MTKICSIIIWFVWSIIKEFCKFKIAYIDKYITLSSKDKNFLSSKMDVFSEHAVSIWYIYNGTETTQNLWIKMGKGGIK